MRRPAVTKWSGRSRLVSFARAFSLAEVAIALGIIAFVLMALLGLLSVGLNAGKDSQLDTVQAALVHRLVSDLRTADFDTLTQTNLLFDYAGGTNSPALYFECDVVFFTPTDVDPAVANHLRRVTIEIRHPYGVTNQSTNILHASLARQD